MEDQYHSLARQSEGLYKEKGSKFLAFAYPVKTQEEIDAHLGDLRKAYYDARHVCYAWRLGPKGQPFRAADDGEPSHSAGDPILNELRSFELSDALVAVVRYFGGTKLGVGGLIRAYGTAAREAIEANEIVEVVLTEDIPVRFAYDRTSEVNRMLHKLQLEAHSSDYAADCRQTFRVRLSEAPEVRRVFAEMGILEED